MTKSINSIEPSIGISTDDPEFIPLLHKLYTCHQTGENSADLISNYF